MRVKSVVRGFGLGLALAAWICVSGHVWADQTGASTAPAGAAAVVAQAIEAAGQTYAGACASTQSPRDLGAICSKYVAAQAGVYAFQTGQTFSEFTQWVFVTQAGNAWQVVAIVPMSNSMTDASVPWPAAGSLSPQPSGMLAQDGAA